MLANIERPGKPPDNHRESNVLSPQDATKEKEMRESFAIAYKYYWEKHTL
jgi:hypothetical protein